MGDDGAPLTSLGITLAFSIRAVWNSWGSICSWSRVWRTTLTAIRNDRNLLWSVASISLSGSLVILRIVRVTTPFLWLFCVYVEFLINLVSKIWIGVMFDLWILTRCDLICTICVEHMFCFVCCKLSHPQMFRNHPLTICWDEFYTSPT